MNDICLYQDKRKCILCDHTLKLGMQYEQEAYGQLLSYTGNCGKRTAIAKSKARDFCAWTDDEVDLLLKVTKEFKVAMTVENIDWYIHIAQANGYTDWCRLFSSGNRGRLNARDESGLTLGVVVYFCVIFHVQVDIVQLFIHKSLSVTVWHLAHVALA